MATQRSCFVIMPFAERFREIYDHVYKPVCEMHGLKCWRVDELARPGSITRDIVAGIFDADILIADLTEKNPNVFYELGIAHSVGNKTIMVAQSKEDVPFDIANYRVIFYEQSVAGSKKFAIALDDAIRELTACLDQTNNPVQEVFGTHSVGRFRKRTPLIQAVNLASLHKKLRNLVSGEGLRYIDELKGLDLAAMKTKYGLGKDNLSNLVKIILECDAYDDLDALQEFIMEHSLSTSGSYRTRDILIKKQQSH